MSKFLTEADIDLLEERFKEAFVTKEEFMEYKSDLFDKLDEIVKNTKDTKDEIELIEGRVTQLESPHI